MLSRCRPFLGTFVEVTADAAPAIEAAFEAISRVHRLMSAHDPQSELSQINRFAHQRPVEVGESTLAVLDRAIFWARWSGGAFNPVAAGRQAIQGRRLPLHEDQPTPEASCVDDIDFSGRHVRLARPGCIDLGGIAKGFAVDEAVSAMKKAGATEGLVNAGGDLAAFGPTPRPVQVLDPARRSVVANVAVQNGALATSAVLPDGHSVHLPGRHGDLVSTTVFAPSATDADALTKIVLCGCPATEQCLRVVGAQALIMRADGSVHTLEPQREAA